jgi:hypothetical protein
MASPDQIRKALMKLMSQPKRQSESTLQDNLGVPPDDIFDAPGHNIRMSEEAAGKAREAVTGSPDKPKIIPPEDAPNENLSLEVMEEVTGPRSRVTTQKRTTMDEMDDVFGEEQTKQVEAIRKQLNEQGIKRSRVPTERDRAEVLNVARDQVKLKEVDQMAKRVFDKVEDLERALIMPKGSTQEEIASSGIAQARRRLMNFKREAAQAAKRARESGNASELIALEDRLTAGLNPAAAPKESLSKTLRLREQRKNKNPMIGHNRPPK